MNISVQEYRKQVGFDDESINNNVRAKYLLFYVTRVVKLRNDMTISVICERLHDWGYQNASKVDIKNAFNKDSDIFLSKARKGAYEITQPAEFRINKKLISFERRIWKNTVANGLMCMVLASIVGLLALNAYGIFTKENSLRYLSLPEFRQRIQFDRALTPSIDRAKYFLFFITRVIQIKDEMTPQVIVERLESIGYSDINESQILKAFIRDQEIIESKHVKGAFIINPRFEDNFLIKLGERFPKLDSLTPNWLIHHLPWKAWVALVSFMFGVMSIAFYAGYRLALHAPVNE